MVTFQKMLWKIFYGVWLYGWKCYFPTTTKIKITQKTHFLTFSHLLNKYIILSLNSETQIKHRKKKIIIRSNWEKKEEKEDDWFWGRGRSVLGCDDRDRGWRIWVRDWGRWIGAATVIAIGAKAKSNGEVERRRRRVKLNGDVEQRSRRVWFEVERRSRSRTALRSGFDLFLGAISLAGAWLAGGVCSLPLSSSSISLSLSSLSLSLSLSIFRKIVFEGKIKTEINLHPTHGQLKTIFGKCIFHAQPNTRKYGKAFSEVIFTQNKHSVSFNIYHSKKKKIDLTLNVLCFVQNKWQHNPFETLSRTNLFTLHSRDELNLTKAFLKIN